jgi:hypothetical protein
MLCADVVQHLALSARKAVDVSSFDARSTARLTAMGGRVQNVAGVLVAGSLAVGLFLKNKNHEKDSIEEAKRWAATPRI